MTTSNIFNISQFVKPVKIETQKAQLFLKSNPAQLSIDRKRGGFDMQSHPIKADIDNRGFFDSIGLKSIDALADDLIKRGKEAVVESMSRYTQEGNTLALPQNKNGIAKIALQRTNKSIDSMLIFIPEEKPRLNWEGGDVDISYTPDELYIRWTILGVETKYKPYSVDYYV